MIHCVKQYDAIKSILAAETQNQLTAGNETEGQRQMLTTGKPVKKLAH